MIPPTKAEQYRKVRIMETHGATPEERATARRVRVGLDEKYPGIGANPFRASGTAQPAPEPDGAFGFPPGNGPPYKRAAVDHVMDWLRGAAEAYTEAKSADSFAEEACTVDVKVLKSGTVKVTMTIDADAIAELVDERPDLVLPFSRAVGSRVSDYLSALLTGAEVDDG